MTTEKIRDALWKLLFLRPFDTAPSEIMKAQEAARDAIAQVEADEAALASAVALELGEVKEDDNGEEIFLQYYADDICTLHHFTRSPMINFICKDFVISLNRKQVEALIATLQRWLNTGSFKFSAPSQQPTQ